MTALADPAPRAPLAPPASRDAAAKVVIPLLAALTLLPWVSAGAALITGVFVAVTLGNPWPARTRALAAKALTWSVVGLGAGMNLIVVFQVGARGFGYTAVGIATALALGTFLGKRLHVAHDVSLLVTVGTAICGGSAIAAVAPSIGANDEDVSLALVTVFLLNAVALFLFPFVGHAFGLGQESFGLWCALAIHDTSSVVGAASQYGPRALEVATATKLARALWIIPVTFALAALRARAARQAGTQVGTTTTTPKRPWFIAGFVAVAALVTFVPALHAAGHLIAEGAHRLLVTTLFLIGLGLSRKALRSLGLRPLVQGVALWIVLATLTLTAIVHGWIG